MKKLWQLLVLGCAALAVPTLASAQSLGLNFAATDPDAATSSLNPTDVAGALPQPNWNNLDTNIGTDVGGLVKSDGTASTATVSWNSNNTWRSTDTGNNAFSEGANRKLMAGYLDTLDTAAGAVSVTVNNIDAALRAPAYDVYVYFLGDSGENRGGGYTVDDGVTNELKYGSTMAMPTMHVEDPGTDVNNSLDGTYLRFRRLTGTSLMVTGDTTLTTPNGFRAPINGIQIHARPARGDVDGDGFVDLDDFHIIRNNLFETGRTDSQGDIAGFGGIVDFADYREWKLHAPAAAVAASVSFLANVPEPGSAILLVVGAALFGFATRRSRGARS